MSIPAHAGKDLDDEVSFYGAPRVELETRSKEGDMAISPFSEAHSNRAPPFIMEVGVCHETLEELELEGEEWMWSPEVQVHSNAREPHPMVHGGPAEPDAFGRARGSGASSAS